MKIEKRKVPKTWILGHSNIYSKGVEGILSKRERDKDGDGGRERLREWASSEKPKVSQVKKIYDGWESDYSINSCW